MFDVFGSEMPLAAKFFVAFAVVLALIGLTAWLVRRFGANRLGSSRGRQPRLAVIDAAPVDGRRRLVLIRRDNIEHLLMIGGPTDLVVEPNIVRAVGTREVAREQQPRMETQPASRATSPAEGGAWPLQPSNEPAPIAPAAAPRPYRSNATDEPWLPADAGARARPTADLSGLASELSARLNPEPPAPPVLRAEPRVSVAPPSEPAPPPQTDHNLAEMAQQLEAALRRTPMPEGRPPVTDPLAVPPKTAEMQRIPPREPKPRNEPRLDMKPEPKLEPRLEPAATPGKALYDNLEQEMASLLGRPPGKS